MQQPPISAPVAVQPKPRPFLFRGGIALACSMATSKAESPAMSLFLLGVAAVTAAMYFTSGLTLSEDGFETRNFGRRHAYRWNDIDKTNGFVIIRQRMLGLITTYQWIGWRFAPEYKRPKIVTGIARAMGKTDARIDPLGHSAKDLALLMNGYLQRAKPSSPSFPRSPAAWT